MSVASSVKRLVWSIKPEDDCINVSEVNICFPIRFQRLTVLIVCL